MNIAVWWSSLLFILAALAAFDQFAARTDGTRAAWIIWAGLFALMSYDELGSLHERLGSNGWAAYLPFVLPIAFLLAYALHALYRNPETRSTVWILLVALALVALSPLMEFLGDELTLSPALQVARSAFEEGIELASAILCLWAAVRLRNAPDKDSTIQSVFITPVVIRWLPVLIAVGAVAHVVGVLYAATFQDNGRRGDPGAWYPAITIVVLSMYAYWQVRSASNVQIRRFYIAVAALLLAASVATPYLLSPRTISWLPYATYAALLLLIMGLRAVSGLSLRGREIAAALSLVILLLLGYVLNNTTLMLKLDVGIFVTGLWALVMWTSRAEVVEARNQPVTRNA